MILAERLTWPRMARKTMIPFMPYAWHLNDDALLIHTSSPCWLRSFATRATQLSRAVKTFHAKHPLLLVGGQSVAN